ncbi:MAG TPA: glycogen synthase GlgA, partial [Burkholderiales bacterium]
MALAPTLRVLYATSELAPWVKSGGLGDVSAALPSALRAAGADVRVLVPGYARLIEALPDARVMCELADLGGAFEPARLLYAERGLAVPLYLIDCPHYYHRPGSAYQDAQGRDWDDNYLRFGLLSRVAALLAAAGSPLEWQPDVLQCNDWPAALAPAYLHYGRASGAAATLMTVHNLAFQGNYDAHVLAALALPPEAYTPEGVEFYGRVSFLKAGLYFADRINTVSERYAEEIQTEAFGCGFEGLLRHRRSRLSGITNGVDTTLWNPATDALLASRYDARHLAHKTPNKLALQKALGLQVDAGIPLLGVVSRLTHQKGLDLLAACVPDIVALGAQLAVLGTGEKALEAEFARLAAIYPRAVSTVFAFDEKLAHLIEAGADIFVMPSRFE